ncbi:hypothetical protein L1987_55189 [Smallanthus sonchifolius]|uniref:Uncharacterized protein n=1 Tax=Smallanthus sonchifolius TaxID=185202 RepID=A0ACB9E9A8_9ASTR|nr:hypothetical protein L1987_55189 [Smallanthus sonchifolius]
MSTTSTSSINMSVATALCRKRAVDKSLDEEQWGLATWALDFIKAGNLKHIVDSEIRAQISPKCLKDFVRIVERCLHNNPKQRPTMAEVMVSLESVLTVQEKPYRSLQVTGRTILGRMFYFFPFTSNRGDSMVPSIIKGRKRIPCNAFASDKNIIVDESEFSENAGIPNPHLKVFEFADLESATRNFRQDLHLGRGHFAELFIGWIDENSFAPSKCGDGVAVIVKRSRSITSQRHDQRLGEDFNAKLINFGLGKSCLEFGQTSYSSLVATRHIVDPEYTRTGHFNEKSDIYGFGVVLMEALTALPAMGANTPNEQYSLVDWACQILTNKRNLKEIMDPRLENNYPLEGAFECGALALKCVENDPSDRPSSEEVLQNLERIYAVSLIWKDYLEEKT